MMDILVCYCEEWNTNLVTSKQHYIRRLAKDNARVIYAEVPKSIFHLIFSKNLFKNIYDYFFGLHFYEVEKNIWIMKNYTFFPYSRKLKIFDNLKINKINQTFVRKSIEKCFKKIDFKEPILISYYPFIYPVINKISFKKIIFHVIDNWMAFDVPKTMNILIQNMTSRAHITITSSAMMYENLKEFSNNIFLLDHGTDLDLFKPVINYEAKEHSLIKNLKKPVIGYYGALHKIDFELVNKISKIHTDKSFIFIGPVKGDQGLKGNLQVSKNIYIYDSIARSELPNILVGLDLFWMPFKKDEITKYMLPIKLFEVLSAGLPVISTDLPECRRVSKNLVKYGETLADFSNLIHSEVDDKDIDMRYHRAKEMGEYDWNQRYLTFKNFITTKNE